MSRPLASIKLRTRLLFSFILVITALMCATLLVVRHTAQVQVQDQIERTSRNAILTFQVTQHQHELALKHTADLLATVALMRNADPTAVDDPTEDPWRSEDCDLFVLADSSGKITALRTTGADFPQATAEQMLRNSLKHHSTTSWWFDGRHLYQVVLEPIRDNSSPNNAIVGTVVVGHNIDNRDADELQRISSTQVVFRYGKEVVVSTFAPLEEQQAANRIKAGAGSSRIQISNQQFFANSVNLTPGLQPPVTLTVLESYKDSLAILSHLNHLMLALGLLGVFVGGALAFVISDTFTRPLGTLVEGVHALEEGNFAYPLELRGNDEVGHVTRAFHRMRNTLQTNETQRQQLEHQLRHSQKMEAVGRLAGGVAHDFNNLLTIIKGHNSLLLEQLRSTDPLAANSRQIDKAADRAVSLIRQLMAFCRKQVLQPKVLDLNSLVSEMGKLLTRLIPEDVSFSFRPDESLGRVKADPGQIEQVILNLVVNACDAMPYGGNLAIETRNVRFNEEYVLLPAIMPAGDYVVLSVKDNGCGMDAATKSRIFEPFFTTKSEGKGTGLGLATVYGVVKQSGGYIAVDSEPGEGARFEIYLPRALELAASDAESPAKIASLQKTKTVLIAEDEDEVRELASRFLQSAGYRVLAAADGAEALAIAKQSKNKIHALVTDIVMPQIRGPELARELKKIYPELKVLYMSGYVENRGADGKVFDENAFLQKPFSRETLVAKVSQVLDTEPIERPSALAVPRSVRVN